MNITLSPFHITDDGSVKTSLSDSPKDAYGNLVVTQARNTQDAFARLRVSSPISQFDYQNQYNVGPFIWSDSLSGTGSVTHQPNSSTVLMSTGGTASGAKAYRQTRKYMRYNPGKSLLPIVTFNFQSAQNNVRKRVGYFDANNGIFLQQTHDVVSVVLRSRSSGSVVETVVPQNQWNCDKMDGKGKSGITVDWTKCQILFADIQWLGVGTIRIGLEIDGTPYCVHTFDNANLTSTTYMTTANLPIRYEVENLGTTSSAGTLLQICSTVITEQGTNDDGGYYTHSANSGITAINVTTRRNVLAIRPKLLLNSITNRAKISISDIELMVGGNNVLWELVYNPTLGGSPSYTSVSDNSPVEFDIAGTTITGGEVIKSGYVPTGTGILKTSFSDEVTNQFPLALDIDGANPTLISLVCTSVTGTATVSAAMTFKEFY